MDFELWISVLRIFRGGQNEIQARLKFSNYGNI